MSPMYRNRVWEVSPSYRIQSVVQLTEQHIDLQRLPRAGDGNRTRVLSLGSLQLELRDLGLTGNSQLRALHTKSLVFPAVPLWSLLVARKWAKCARGTPGHGSA